jgi:hypothetical protein
MTRKQAIDRATAAMKVTGATWGPLSVQADISILEALGLLKLEEPMPKTHFVPAVQVQDAFPLGATIREDTLVETLRMAGYEVTKVDRSNPMASGQLAGAVSFNPAIPR